MFPNASKNILPAATALVFLLTAPVSSGNAGEVYDMAYDITVGPTRLFSVKYSFTLERTAYSGTMRLKPHGLAKLFANISMHMQAAGKLDKNGLRPERFDFASKKKGKRKSRNVIWKTKKVPVTTRSWQVSAAKQASLTANLTQSLIDPVSAFLRTGIQAAGAACKKAYRVYDGGKIYDLKFSLEKKVSFGKGAGGVYRGPAYKCVMRHFPVAGYSAKKLRKHKKNPVVFTIWFAPVKSAELKKTILVPVAAAGSYKGRKFTALARRARLSGVNLSRFAAALK